MGIAVSTGELSRGGVCLFRGGILLRERRGFFWFDLCVCVCVCTRGLAYYRYVVGGNWVGGFLLIEVEDF